MVLYHAANASCYVKCLLHRCLYHSSEEAVFVGYEHLSKEFFKPDKYKVYLEYAPLLGPFGTCNQLEKEKVLDKIEELFDGLFSKYDLNLSDFQKIYVGSYYSEFAMYVNMKGKRHSVFEEAAGDWKPLEWVGFDTFNSIIEQLNMKYFNNSLVEYRYGTFCVWAPEYRSSNDINFEPYKEIYQLNDNDRKYFVDKFHLPQIDFGNDRKNLLLLTQWFFKEGGGKWKDARIVTMYRVLLDYFIDDIEQYSVYIKPHPADPVQEGYSRIREAKVISPKCISELLGLVEGISFELAVTISSHSLYTVNEFTQRTRQIGYKLVSLYPLIHKYYFAFVCLTDYLLPEASYRFGIMDEEYSFIKEIPQIGTKFNSNDVKWRSWEFAGNSVMIIHRLAWKDNQGKFVFDHNKIDENTVCVFFDIDELVKYATGDVSFIIDNSVVFQVKKINRYTGLVDGAPEYIYCFTKSALICNHLRMYTYLRTLKYEETILKIFALTETEVFVQKEMLKNRIKKLSVEERLL